jgi:hypothetical protein
LKGLELSEKYYNEICAPMVSKKFAEYRNRIAIGLVGEGSECFGFDDEISRDHDWGVSLYLWLNKIDYELIGIDLQNEYNKLPKEFNGFGLKRESTWGSGRSGVFEISSFYKRFIGLNHVPSNLLEWRIIPEVNLSVATNGKVFIDTYGEFTSFRNQLKDFYPEDIRLKKIAARCMKIAQSGQYNYPRSIRRKELVAAQLSEAEFMEAAISMVFLLNKKYRPFYKWMHRAMQFLPILGGALYQLFSEMVAISKDEKENVIYEKKIRLIEEICTFIIEELKRQELSDSSSDFLLEHGVLVQNKIQDNTIKKINVWLE